MKRFIVNSEPDKNGRVYFEGGDYRYLVRVRRLAPGEFFPALLPGGTEVTVQVLSVDGRVLTGELVQYKETGNEFPQELLPIEPSTALPPIILFQALPKSDKMDLIVRQAAEGSLDEIVPFLSEFTVVKINNSAHKLARWERIIKEARQQSGSMRATMIRQPVTMDGLLTYWEQIKSKWPDALGLLFHHLPLAHDSLHGYLGKRPEAIVIAIGPEGGFSPAEVKRFVAAGFSPFTIGETVLRTETAALYAQAAVRVLLLERNSWETN